MKRMPIAPLAGALLAASALTATAAEDVDLILNWTPGADHAPIFYALEQGWYEEAGIDLTVESGKGSGLSSQTVGAGASDIGIAELGTAFVAKSKGAELTAVMTIYANAPFVLYWKKSNGIAGPQDFAGRTVGNPPGDAARVMWPAFAEAVGLEKDSVEFVNVSPAAKVPTLAADRVDVISDFYNGHDVKLKEFGDDLGFLRWSEHGINPYGNSFIVNDGFLAENPRLVADFVAVTQRAYAACVEDEAPCIDALMTNASGLDRQAMVDQWGRVKELMADDTTTSVALGAFDAARMQETYDLVDTYFEIETPFDPAQAYTNEHLDESIKMTAPQGG
ncbi:ABC transporter substrate-binding protein [Aquibium sp. A9E412]|uniref:ABC transporter substrate-binding protein n=1 Tax=Aquibium sp. A9E412 TaxID=2976767 RepID=UPI0025B067A0|nr:ABC transporter substrate-binding protein [Aquibium sp. A9E412]MDN2567600.1 ABC transporter substrate-binding protein [Aquibium sp. A9E412]